MPEAELIGAQSTVGRASRAACTSPGFHRSAQISEVADQPGRTLPWVSSLPWVKSLPSSRPP